MERLSFAVERRAESGSSANRRLRRRGWLPAVVYSHGEETVPVKVLYHEFSVIAKKSRSSQIFVLRSEDKVLDGKPVIVKEIQKDILKGLASHVDLQALRENEAITVRVPLNIKGEAVGVKLGGGILTVLFHELGIRCLPRNIPESIDIEISELNVGDSIHAGNLALPEGVDLADDAHETIVSVVAPKIEEEKAPTPAEGEVAAAAGEGAAATGDAAAAAGATPAAGAKGQAAAPAKEKSGGK